MIFFCKFQSFSLSQNKQKLISSESFCNMPPGLSLSFQDSEDIFLLDKICIIVFLFFFKKKKSSFRVFEFYQTFITIPIPSFLPSREVVFIVVL